MLPFGWMIGEKIRNKLEHKKHELMIYLMSKLNMRVYF